MAQQLSMSQGAPLRTKVDTMVCRSGEQSKAQPG
jgi:hypothetical protein